MKRRSSKKTTTRNQGDKEKGEGNKEDNRKTGGPPPRSQQATRADAAQDRQHQAEQTRPDHARPTQQHQATRKQAGHDRQHLAEGPAPAVNRHDAPPALAKPWTASLRMPTGSRPTALASLRPREQAKAEGKAATPCFTKGRPATVLLTSKGSHSPQQSSRPCSLFPAQQGRREGITTGQRARIHL